MVSRRQQKFEKSIRRGTLHINGDSPGTLNSYGIRSTGTEIIPVDGIPYPETIAYNT